ncbi:MAG: Inorganic pyrophosphatase [Microgenomates group bacterium GW2011_GWA2_46_16]|nr:MAG: Inorganic pyrophosphatase [Microgenomates group bacterium GW2011_GWA2_46_16]
MDIKVFVEIPEGSQVKYERDEETGMLMCDRILHTPMSFPFNYGCVLESKGEDGDPTDIVLLASATLVPGVGIKAKLIGMLEMTDEEGVDTKLIAVPIQKVDPLFGTWNDVSDIPQHTKNKIKHFFDHYKDLEPGKFVKTGAFLGAADAVKVLEADMKRGVK